MKKAPAAGTSLGSKASEGKQPRRWSELLGDTLYEFVGDPASTATRKVVAIHSLTPLAKRQKAARIPPTYHGALLAIWDEDKANPGVSEIVQGYIQRPDRRLYFCGSVGASERPGQPARLRMNSSSTVPASTFRPSRNYSWRSETLSLPSEEANSKSWHFSLKWIF